jgi:hypothetical protein
MNGKKLMAFLSVVAAREFGGTRRKTTGAENKEREREREGEREREREE